MAMRSLIGWYAALCIALIAVGGLLLWFSDSSGLGVALVVAGAIGMAPVPVRKLR